MKETPRGILPLVAPLVFLLSVLAAGALMAETYWYERYLRAIELIEIGRPADAAALLEELIEQHSVPQAAVRVPGDLFIDYLPYYQLARANSDLGRFRDADRALARSLEFGAIDRCRRRHTRELDRLLRTIKKQTL